MWYIFKVNNKDTRATPVASFWCLYWQLWTYFTPCSCVSIVNFKQANAKLWMLFGQYLVHLQMLLLNVQNLPNFFSKIQPFPFPPFTYEKAAAAICCEIFMQNKWYIGELICHQWFCCLRPLTSCFTSKKPLFINSMKTMTQNKIIHWCINPLMPGGNKKVTILKQSAFVCDLFATTRH